MITFRRIVAYAFAHALKRAGDDMSLVPNMLAEELRVHLRVHGFVIKRKPDEIGRPMTPDEMKLLGLEEADAAEAEHWMAEGKHD